MPEGSRAVSWDRSVRVLRAADVECPCGAAIGMDCNSSDLRRPYCGVRLQIVRGLAERGELEPQIVEYVPVYNVTATVPKAGAHPKLSPDQLKAMLAEKADGRSTAWLSQKYRISESSIHRLAKEARERESPGR